MKRSLPYVRDQLMQTMRSYFVVLPSAFIKLLCEEATARWDLQAKPPPTGGEAKA